jgi:ribosomal protein L11 methylase PrmA
MALAVLTLRCGHHAIDALTTSLWERGTLGIQESELPAGEYQIEAYFNAPFDASSLEGFVSWHTAAEYTDQTWKDAWQPRAVGEKLWLVPHWLDALTPPGRKSVAIYPGQASGTSYSEPTLLMLEALEKELRPGDTIADIGTGSGILTAAAHALGAGRLLCCDVDPTSAIEAAANLYGQSIAAQIWCGSPRSLKSRTASLVVANINAIQLEALAPELTRILTPGGRLLLGGFTDRNRAHIERIFNGPAARRYSRGPWRAVVLESAN